MQPSAEGGDLPRRLNWDFTYRHSLRRIIIQPTGPYESIVDILKLAEVGFGVIFRLHDYQA